jgi:hypothetical protein
MQKITSDMAGCWLDGARGIYIGDAIQKIAQEYGWTGEMVRVNDVEYQGACYNWGAIDEAEEYMQNLAPDGFAFGMSEQGDWGLWQIEEN